MSKYRNTHRIMAFAGLALFAQAAAQPAAAQQSGPLAVSNTVQLDKITMVAGRPVHTLIDIDKTREKVPGAHLVRRLTYHNVGAVTITHIVVTDPLPAQEMLSDDAFGAASVSVDKGKTYGNLATMSVSDGKGGSRPATPADVTNLSWTIPSLAAGASVTLEFHSLIR